MHQIVFRARKNIPLPPLRCINLILEGAIARAQTVYPVVLSHFLFTGNHPHIFAIPLDANDFKGFYGLLEKELTEALKKLTGLEHARIWEGAAKVTRIATLEDFINEVAYCYANPASAHLEDKIERYPGVSTWREFRDAPLKADAAMVKRCLWIRRPYLKALPSRRLSGRQDRHFTENFKQKARKYKAYNQLRIEPYAFCKVYGVSNEELAQVKERIIDALRRCEGDARDERRRLKKSVIGKHRLREKPIFAEHTPKKNGPALHVIAYDKQYKIQLLKEFKTFCQLCRDAYEAWKRGDFTVQWPPGAYKPPLPVTVNYISC